MLNINNKIYLNSRFTAADVDLNVMLETVVTHILTHSYSIADTHIEDIEFDDVLFISDRHIDGRTLLLESSDFKETGVTMQRSNFPKRIRCCNAVEFNEITEDLDIYKDGVNLVIVGFLNVIPEHIVDNILDFYGSFSNIVVFGDPIVDAPEHNNYFMKYLTNASISVKLDYDNFRLSDKKKINNTLFKLRKDVSDVSEITNSNYVSVNHRSEVDLSECCNSLLNGETVVVPKRHYAHVNSLILQHLTSNVKLDFQPGDILLSKYIWLVSQDGNKYVIPPLTNIRIVNIHNQVFIQDHRCFICDVSIEKEGSVPLIINKAVIDFTDYLLNFEPTYFPDNLEDFEDIMKYNQFDTNIHDATVLKVIFCKCFTTDMTKYYNSSVTNAFVELIERDILYSTDFNYYKLFARTTDRINLVISDELIIE